MAEKARTESREQREEKKTNVEIAETEKLLSNPVHPYTKRLISSIPVPDPKYNRVEYDLNYDELDEIIKNNPDKKMVDIGGEHYIATHDVKDILY